MDKKYDLSIVLPMYKPKQGWENCLKENMQLLRLEFNYAVSIEFIVVNDGSESQHLLSLLEVLQQDETDLRFITYADNMGKGYALRTGVAAAKAPVVITTDLDFPYELRDIKNVYALLKSGNEIVTGKRTEEYYAATPLKRKLLSKACVTMNRHLLKLPLADAQSGLKGFNKKGKALFLETTVDRFLVDTEFLVLAHKLKLSIAVLELNLKAGVKFSSMGWKVLTTELNNFYYIMKVNKKSFSPKEAKRYAQPASVVNV
jgi:dolichyl-phosphate beta-glucosyltransferase